MGGIVEDVAGQQSRAQRSGGGHEAAEVVAEGHAGASQPRGEQLGEIDGIAAEDGKLARAHQRRHPENVARLRHAEERRRRRQGGGDKRQGKSRPPAKPLGDAGEGVNAEKAADVEHHQRDGGPLQRLYAAGLLPPGDSLDVLFERILAAACEDLHPAAMCVRREAASLKEGGCRVGRREPLLQVDRQRLFVEAPAQTTVATARRSSSPIQAAPVRMQPGQRTPCPSARRVCAVRRRTCGR